MTKLKLVAVGLFWGSLAMAQTPQAGGPPPGMEKAREACAPDIQKLCPDVKPGGGRIIQCLRSHATEVSDPCKTAMQQAHGHRHGAGGAGPGGATPPPAN